MVVPIVVAAVAVGGAAAAAGFFFLLRKLWKKEDLDNVPPMFMPQAAPLELLPRYENSRPLGQMEFIMMKLHELDKGILSVALVLEMKTAVTDGVMKQVLGKLAKIHPLMRMMITKSGETGVPVFEPMKEPSVLYEKLASGDWEEVLSKEIEKKFDLATGPLWRAVFLPNAKNDTNNPSECVLILSFQRSIVDEGFMAELTSQLMRFLNEEMSKKTHDIMSFDLLPALDVNFTRQDVDANWYDHMSARIAKVTEERIENVGEINENEPKEEEVTKAEKKKSSPQGVVSLMLDRETTEKLFDRCARYDVAISAALEVAAVLAYCHDDDKDGVLPIQIEQSIFLKPLLPAIPLEYCGNFSVENLINTAVPRSSKYVSSFWNLSITVTEGLAITMQNAVPVVQARPSEEEETKLDSPPEGTENPIGVEEMTKDEEAVPRDRSNGPEVDGLRVATMGAYAEDDAEASVSLKGFFGHIGLRKAGPSIGHCHAAVNDQLCWTLSYRKDKYSKQEAEKLIQKTFDYLNKSLLNDLKVQDIAGVTPHDADEEV